MKQNNRINVLFDQRVIPNYRVGIFRKLANLPGIDLTVSYWVKRFTDDTPHVYGELGFKTVAFQPISYRINGKYYWLNIDLVKYVFRKRPDVIIGPIGMFCVKSVFSKMLESALRIITGVRFVYRTSFGLLPGVRPNTSPNGLRKLFYKILYRDVVVTTYTERAAAIAIAQGCPADRVFIDYNSMDSDELLTIRRKLDETVETWKPDFYKKYCISKRRYVLFAGSIYPEKRLDLLIKAWRHLINRVKDVQLVIVGSGLTRDDEMHQFKDIDTHVRFVDAIYETEELAKFYHQSEIVVFPGAAGLSVHFAMCFGKAIITSMFGNEAVYVQNDVNGFVYDYGNVRELANKIETLLVDRKLRENFGSESERIVRKQINVEHLLSTIVLAIRKAVEQ